MLKSVYAPPCVEPFEGDNGGATSAGVTADAVTVVFYRADPALDPLTAAPDRSDFQKTLVPFLRRTMR